MRALFCYSVLTLVASGCIVVSDTKKPTRTGTEVAGAPAPRGGNDTTTGTDNPTPENPTPNPPNPSTPVRPDPRPMPYTVSLERTACFGRCPMYVVSMDAHGAVTFQGERFVAQTGRHAGNVSANKVTELRKMIADSDIFSMKDCYCERRVTDMPSVIVTITWGGQKKTIKHYTGDRSAPQKLLDLQVKIDDVLGSARWVKPPIQ